MNTIALDEKGLPIYEKVARAVYAKTHPNGNYDKLYMFEQELYERNAKHHISAYLAAVGDSKEIINLKRKIKNQRRALRGMNKQYNTYYRLLMKQVENSRLQSIEHRREKELLTSFIREVSGKSWLYSLQSFHKWKERRNAIADKITEALSTLPAPPQQIKQ